MMPRSGFPFKDGKSCATLATRIDGPGWMVELGDLPHDRAWEGKPKKTKKSPTCWASGPRRQTSLME